MGQTSAGHSLSIMRLSVHAPLLVPSPVAVAAEVAPHQASISPAGHSFILP
jgi:hypothetical protein